ncbi:MAG TPA: tetratricopeptide repeat protein [Candidatus Angelobacter sp.]|jgi:tetratricopeptide (TPR) repeat protein|nr:tetratricopeptide repeat protein [Candidatus Angelobacter sp.]
MRRRNLMLAIVILAVLDSVRSASAAGSPAQMIASASVDEAIRTLSGHNDAASLNLLSRAYYAVEQWDNAIAAGEKSVSQSPDNAMFHLWLGREYGGKAGAVNPLSAVSFAKKTKAEFEQAVKFDPANVQAHADLAEYYTDAPSIMGGGLDKAREQATQVAKYDEATSHWILAIIAEKGKSYSEAEGQLQQALKVAQNPAQYWMNLASFYRRRSRPDDMQKAISQALAQPNKPAEVYYNAASELFQAGRDFSSAVQYLKKYLSSGAMVEDAPAFRAHYVLGQIYEKMGNQPDAAAEYKASLALATGFAPASKALSRVQ